MLTKWCSEAKLLDQMGAVPVVEDFDLRTGKRGKVLDANTEPASEILLSTCTSTLIVERQYGIWNNGALWLSP